MDPNVEFLNVLSSLLLAQFAGSMFLVVMALRSWQSSPDVLSITMMGNFAFGLYTVFRAVCRLEESLFQYYEVVVPSDIMWAMGIAFTLWLAVGWWMVNRRRVIIGVVHALRELRKNVREVFVTTVGALVALAVMVTLIVVSFKDFPWD